MWGVCLHWKGGWFCCLYFTHFCSKTEDFDKEFHDHPSHPLSSARMAQLSRLAIVLLTLCAVCRLSFAFAMDKLADAKLCVDEECSRTISVARVIEDFIAPDCRFINLRQGQTVYVYSKLVAEEGAGVFWSGSVYSDRYVEQMGIVGYFPSNLVKEMHVFEKAEVELPTQGVDFYCI
uniref:Otoraplin n=2 Tax=Paramormyrops kingsleyae TaxID=1676925 RepID=A0A3B3RRZ1_9TELE